jgi:predicted transcriptional regulator
MAKSYLYNLMKNGFVESESDGTRIIYRTASKGLELQGRFELLYGELDEINACA